MQGSNATTQWQSGEITEEKTLLEVIGVDIKVGNSFEERKVAEYIEQRGMEDAVATLARNAGKNPTARTMYDIAMKWLEQAEAHKQQERIDQVFHKRSDSPVSHGVQHIVLDEKERLSKLASMLNLQYDDIQVDREWNPIVNVEYHHGKAQINGKNVWFPRRFRAFMGQNVLRKQSETVPMHIVKVKDDQVTAIPDEQRFKQLKKQHQTIDVEEFKGVVSILGQGLNVFPFIALDVVKKKVYSPRKYDKDLLLKPGVWTFTVIEEQEDCVYVKPLEYQEKLSHIIKVHVKRKGKDVEISCDEIPGDIRVPQRYHQKLYELPGDWLLRVLDFKKFKVIAEPFKFAERRKPSPEERRPSPVVDQRPPRVTNALAKDRLEDLMSNGRVCL